MNTMTHLSTLRARAGLHWKYFCIDTLLAILGTLSITGVIYAFQLYPRIPNISVAYLLVVLALASIRGRYSAILSSLVAFLSFDYFIVPPLYTFTIARFEEWLALFVFLAVAIITGQLAATLRQRAEEARSREQEARILYELVGAVNSEQHIEQLFKMLTQAIVTVFVSWGVEFCSLLLPDTQGLLQLQAQTPGSVDSAKPLSAEELQAATRAMQERSITSLYDIQIRHGSTRYIVVQTTTTQPVAKLYFVPLTVGTRSIGVVCLRIAGTLLRFPLADVATARAQTQQDVAFFWTFLDQVTSVIERARLRKESMYMELLQRTDALRSALLSSVSHDLRTPLSSIKASASSLLQDDIEWSDDERRSFAVTIEREADRLNRLVGNLLDMSRIENGALKPEMELYPLGGLIYDVLDRLNTLLKGRSVTTSISQDVPPVELDYLYMDQVLTNLIENAVRYTPPESPLDINVQQQEAQVIISVADRGPGIPPAEMERIFDKFYRVQARRGKEPHPSGSGLGLAVCKGLIEAQGGKIWAEARSDGGVIFSIALPACNNSSDAYVLAGNTALSKS